MATEKPALTVYISEEIKARLDAWKAENKVKSSSAAVEQILAQFFDIGTGDIVTRAELEPLLGKLKPWLTN